LPPNVPLDVFALIVAVIGTVMSIWYSAHNKRMLQKQFDLQFSSELHLSLSQHRFNIHEAKFPILIKNHGPRTATSIKLTLIHQLTGNSVPIDPETELSISADASKEINIFFELNTVLQNLEIYDPIARKILSREPINFAIEYEWKITGLNTIKRNRKDLTFIWQGGKPGGGLEWGVI
jgi:hypothetical protein